MSHMMKVATVQMDAAPASVTDRLNRAARLVEGATVQGAQLIVLPELFNIGYEYDDRNYGLAEPIDGPTMQWMKDQAKTHNVHLAGSFLLLDAEEIYNSAFIVAPDGRTWRYDKIYPFNWERAYFREGRGTTVADTDLGKLGMLICWDAAHADLWKRYAGRVDAMVVTSCPPAFNKASLVFPDGERLPTIMAKENHFQDQDIEDQAEWIQVPVIASQGTGIFRSHLPIPHVSVAALLGTRPDLWKWVQQADKAVLEADYEHFAKVLDARGNVLAQIMQEGDSFAVAEVEMADHTPHPQGGQPKMRTSPVGFFGADAVGANGMISLYRVNTRDQWGLYMAPVDPRTRTWASLVAGAAIVGAAVGFLASRTRPSSDDELTIYHG